MEAVPRYQVVLLDDEYTVSNCNDDDTVCLPICHMSDLRFQLVTNFGDNNGETFLIATPCDSCGDITGVELFSELFSGARRDVNWGASIFNEQNLLLSPTPSNWGGHSISKGDQLFLIADGSPNYTGFHTIEDILPADANAYLTTPHNNIFPPNDMTCSKAQFIQGNGILATNSTQITSGSAFPGSNYLWDFSGVINDQINYNEGDCFRLCIYKITMQIPESCGAPVFESASCLGVTNCFRYMPNSCYTMKIQYQFNENSMGFYGTTLSVRLPMYLSRPQYPGTEKGYQKSNGTFLKLSERINKEWQLKTEWLPDALHERIRIALSADFIQVWNENENLALEGIYRDSDYNIEWHEEVDYPLAKATTTIKKRTLVASVNSNCL